MQHEHIKASGHITVLLIGPDGEVKERREVDNLIVTAGKNWLAQRMSGSPTLMSHMAMGTGAVAPALGDTALGAQAARVALDSQNTANNVTTYVATFPAGTGTGAITEAGIFNASSGGTMLNRATFAVVNKGASDSTIFTWSVTQN